jgi:hypothetical protein
VPSLALSTAQAKALLATIRPRDAAGKARRRVAAELVGDLERLYQRKKAADKELRDLLKATGTASRQIRTFRRRPVIHNHPAWAGQPLGGRPARRRLHRGGYPGAPW